MNLFRNTLITGLFILILAGCNASTSQSGTTTTPGSMVATVNGSAWSSVVLPIGGNGITTKATRSSSGVVTVTGVSSDLTEITLLLTNPSPNQTYTLGGFNGNYYGAYSEGILDTSKAWGSIPWTTNLHPGSVTITQFDTVNRQISGSFSFTARKIQTPNDSVTVTNGSFYQVEWSK